MSLQARTVLSAIAAAEREAAGLLLRATKIMAETKTGRRDVVTEYDRRVQRLLVSRLSAAVPGAAFFCEENNVRESTAAEDVFIIDPIDGTMNFVRHMNNSCISVAYMHRGQLTASAIYDPYRDDMFTALRGEGAYLNGVPISAESVALGETVFCFGSSPYYPDKTEESFRLARIAFDNSLDLRRFASAELDLCSVASGRAGLYFELCISFWDYAAGLLLVEEAGGVCTDIEGLPLPLDGSRSSILAGGKQAHADFLRLISRK